MHDFRYGWRRRRPILFQKRLLKNHVRCCSLQRIRWCFFPTCKPASLLDMYSGLAYGRLTDYPEKAAHHAGVQQTFCFSTATNTVQWNVSIEKIWISYYLVHMISATPTYVLDFVLSSSTAKDLSRYVLVAAGYFELLRPATDDVFVKCLFPAFNVCFALEEQMLAYRDQRLLSVCWRSNIYRMLFCGATSFSRHDSSCIYLSYDTK